MDVLSKKIDDLTTMISKIIDRVDVKINNMDLEIKDWGRNHDKLKSMKNGNGGVGIPYSHSYVLPPLQSSNMGAFNRFKHKLKTVLSRFDREDNREGTR
jgi:hypothetical protein